MGRDWKFYWGGGRSTGTPKSNNNNNNNHDELVDSPSAATGCCINAVFHFQSSFSHHQVIPSFKSQQQQQQLPSTTINEAPRNSLELEIQQPPIPPMEPFSSLNIPAPKQIGIQIQTGSSRTRTRTEDLSSECCSSSSSSPALKSPNLVARLMGLDLLPDQTIPLSSSSSSIKSQYYQTHLLKHSKAQTNNKFILDIDFMGSRSLPETPRISSERRSSNLDDHRRLSLQINNRENIIPEFEQPRNSTGRRDVRVLLDEENRSPGFYARQIVKKVKDNSRKVGSDITNTVNNRQSDHDQIVLSKPSQQGTRSTTDHESVSSCSPRLRSLELKNRGGGVSPGRVDNPKPKQQKHQSSSSDKKCGGIRKEIRRDQVLCINRQSSETIKKKKEEKRPTFKKCKKTPLSSSNLPKLFYPKKDPAYPITNVTDQNQEYDDGSSSERSVQAKTSTVLQAVQERNSPIPIGTLGNQSITETTTCTAEIINKTVDRLEPELISYHSSLSLFDGCASVPNMSLRCNRLLIFDLVNEFLQLELRDNNDRMLKGPDLVRTVCQKIQNFPAAGCNINTTIETDLQGGGGRKLAILEEEREGITEEIEREIRDKLVKETMSLLYYG